VRQVALLVNKLSDAAPIVGVVQVAGLLQLPDNRLFAGSGVGISELSPETWLQLLPSVVQRVQQKRALDGTLLLRLPRLLWCGSSS